MSDPVTIRFLLEGAEQDVARAAYLRSQRGGDALRDLAVRYAKELCRSRKGKVYPLDRMEPGTVLVDFIRVVLEDRGEGPVTHDLSLGAGDPALDDSSHYDIILPGPGGTPERVRVVSDDE